MEYIDSPIHMKIGILITTFNRPEYLKQCLESIRNADIPEGTEILISDDASTSKETLDLINESGFTAIFSKKNGSIKQSLTYGCELLFNTMGCDIVTNLDADAIVRPDFLTRLMELKVTFPEHIITGFNCRTKNRDGSERHRVVKEGDGYNIKRSVGGINMLFDLRQYTQFIKPALIESLAQGGNWDHKACIKSGLGGYLIVCAVPSVVQHIGIKSSMGHDSGGEPPDVADDFFDDSKWAKDILYYQPADAKSYDKYGGERLRMTLDEEMLWPKPISDLGTKKHHLKDVTLVGVDCVNVERLIKAIDVSCERIFFGDVRILTSLKTSDTRAVKIRHLPTKAEYSVFMMKELANYISTKYILVVQHDGYVLNAAAWRNEWLNYDYIGAPWEWYTDGMNVGNGGFSLRTKKIMQITANDDGIIPINEPNVTRHKEEDHCICRLYRKYLESEYKMKFAPIEEARMFSIEGWNSKNKVWNGEFGFHGGHADISKALK